MRFKFTIPGILFGKKVNPVPYTRTTQRQMWVDKNYKRYQCWKGVVSGAFLAFLKENNIDNKPYLKNWLQFKKPINPIKKFRMDIMIYFKDKKHADSDNVYKGISDSLFINDKYISGSMDFDYDKENPRVEVEIEI